MKIQKSAVFSTLVLAAWLAFELFNFASTEEALHVILGNGAILGISLSALGAFAFSAIDLGGFARMVTPEKNIKHEPVWVLSLLAAWLLGAAFNAYLTWFFVSLRISAGIASIPANMVSAVRAMPIVVAAVVFFIRVSAVTSLVNALDGDFKVVVRDHKVVRGRELPAPRYSHRPATTMAKRERSDNRKKSITDELLGLKKK